MNILFDFITLSKKTGAGEYCRRLFFSTIEKINSSQQFFVVWDSNIGIAYEDMKEGNIQCKFPVIFIDLKDTTLDSIIIRYNIDVFFIACSHYVGLYKSLKDVKCKTICVVHDLCDQELDDNHINELLQMERPEYSFNNATDSGLKVYRPVSSTMKYCRWLLGRRRRALITLNNRMDTICFLLKHNPKAILITVSEYTAYSLNYYFGLKLDNVKISYSPERIISNKKPYIENEQLRQIISNKLPFYFMSGAKRTGKNINKLIRVFSKFAEYDSSAILVTAGYPQKMFSNHIALPFLSDSDLDYAYQNCYAFLYPSFFEGFGYPPIEAMKYAKPVLASNVTSIPEILGNAPIYFSPLYASDIFRALKSLSKSNYNSYAILSKKQYETIHQKQEKDLKDLINLILSN